MWWWSKKWIGKKKLTDEKKELKDETKITDYENEIKILDRYWLWTEETNMFEKLTN